MITTESPRTLGADLVDATSRPLSPGRPRWRLNFTAIQQSYRVLTGDRPTGDLHLGHYIGTIANRVRLQNLGVPTYVVVADYQVITDRDAAGPLRDRVRSLVADHLAVGIDPARTVMFPHSAVPALNQLILPFLSLVTDQELRP